MTLPPSALQSMDYNEPNASLMILQFQVYNPLYFCIVKVPISHSTLKRFCDSCGSVEEDVSVAIFVFFDNVIATSNNDIVKMTSGKEVIYPCHGLFLA